VTEVVVTLLSVPHVVPVHAGPETDQVTPLFCESFCTETVKLAAVETCTEVDAGAIETEIGGGVAVMVMMADADLLRRCEKYRFEW
jgi:hypothetical protein